MKEKIIVAVLAAIASGSLTYAGKVLTIEPRIEVIERSVLRIENRLFPPTVTER